VQRRFRRAAHEFDFSRRTPHSRGWRGGRGASEGPFKNAADASKSISTCAATSTSRSPSPVYVRTAKGVRRADARRRSGPAGHRQLWAACTILEGDAHQAQSPRKSPASCSTWLPISPIKGDVFLSSEQKSQKRFLIAFGSMLRRGLPNPSSFIRRGVSTKKTRTRSNSKLALKEGDARRRRILRTKLALPQSSRRRRTTCSPVARLLERNCYPLKYIVAGARGNEHDVRFSG